MLTLVAVAALTALAVVAMLGGRQRRESARWSPGSCSVRTVPVLAVAGLLLAGCATTNGTGGATTASTEPVAASAVDQIQAGPREDLPSALVDPDADVLPDPIVDTAEIISGGPPPDGIPPIDEPTFLPTGAVDFLADDEPVLALEIEGDARAYPIQVMIWHEIVNDTVGDTPVSVTYCPLCNTAVAVDRRVGDRVLSFGTSGSLYQSALVMYDRQTESLWSHFTGQAIAGVLTGAELDSYPVATVAWSDWRDAHPDGLVLSRDTGHDRDYGRNPYPGYDDIDNPPFLFEGEVDARLAAKTRIVGVGLDSTRPPSASTRCSRPASWRSSSTAPRPWPGHSPAPPLPSTPTRSPVVATWAPPESFSPPTTDKRSPSTGQATGSSTPKPAPGGTSSARPSKDPSRARRSRRSSTSTRSGSRGPRSRPPPASSHDHDPELGDPR